MRCPGPRRRLGVPWTVTEHVELAGSGATEGVAMAHCELHAWCLLVLAWVFVPFYVRSRVYAMPEFLERRFSPGARRVLSVISLVSCVLTKIAVGIYAGGVVFAALLPKLHAEIAGTDMFDLWKPLIPAGVQRTWAQVMEQGRRAWHFKHHYPWLGMLFGAPIIGL